MATHPPNVNSPWKPAGDSRRDCCYIAAMSSDPSQPEAKRPNPPAGKVAGTKPAAVVAPLPAAVVAATDPAAAAVAPLGEPAPAGSLTPDEQMARFAKELQENDWGHQPC